MTRQIRTILLTGLFFFGLLTGLQAQDKYEYAIVKYSGPALSIRGLFVSIGGKPFETIEVKKDLAPELFSDYTFALNYVQKMADDGWRVINSFSQEHSLLFVLERKKN